MNRILTLIKCEDAFIKPFVVLNNETVFPEYLLSSDEKTLTLSYKGVFSDEIIFSIEENFITAKRTFEYIKKEASTLNELGIKISGIDFKENPSDDYFYHIENPRIYEKMTFPVDYKRTSEDALNSAEDKTAGNRWADPGVVCERIGRSPYQPFPAILLSNYNTKKGLVHGTLSQDIFYHNYLVNHKNGKIEFDIFSSFKATSYIELSQGRVLEDKWYLGTTDNAENIEKIFEGYTKVLREYLPAKYGKSDINRDNLVWGTWNDGIFRDITEDEIIREARFLKENFPTVRWIQLDDSYAKYAGENNIAHGLGMPYEGNEGIDYEKFPNGLKHLSDEIKKAGLRPAIWIGGFCAHGTKIYKEKPEWFIDYSLRTTRRSPLDVSQEPVREYMEYAANVLCKEYGFEGVKQDFWSYAFEDSHDLYKCKNKSGYEHRKWWLDKLRSLISDDGHFQTGCDIVMANPFLGEHYTNYRYGIDIGSGNWDFVKTNFLWGAACFATHTGDLFVPNSDSVGVFPGLSQNEAMFALNYCLVTHSMVEISGKLSLEKDKDKIKKLKKAVCNPNNGQDIYFVGYDYRRKEYCIPEIIYFNTPHFSKEENNDCLPVRTVGLFNIEDEEKELSFNISDLKLEKSVYIATNVWTNEQYEFTEDFSYNLPPHSSALFAVNKKQEITVYDANTRINNAVLNNNELFLELDYKDNDIELSLSKPIYSLTMNGADIPFTQASGNRIMFTAEDKGTIKILFD